MDVCYKVEMLNQWRPGAGVFVDLNCGWYCQDALLSWYCTRNRLPASLFKGTIKHKRKAFGFDPSNGFCLNTEVPKNIVDFEECLAKHGPVIVAGKVGFADFGCLGGVGHYVLAVGVRKKSNDIIIYDPLSVDFRSLRGARSSVHNFDYFIKKVDEVLVLNEFSLKHMRA